MGLDCAVPGLVFDKLNEDLPFLRSLMSTGLYGSLLSTVPPITIPAWMSMVTGMSPGSLGLYGFRHRRKFSYDDVWIANTTEVRHPTIWDRLGEVGKRSVVVGVPPSYPPRSINGKMVGCFITPSTESVYTHPPELKDEIEQVTGGYMTDVEFRTEDRDTLIKDLYEMTRRRTKLVVHLADKQDWDFFMFVEIGIDRVHHAFWKFFDEGSPGYEPGNGYEDVIPDYYRFVDSQVGEVMEVLDDDTMVLVASDHGAKRMMGSVCINQWLQERGYLVLRSQPDKVTTIEKCDVDWSRTTAWAWGGYYARVFLNVEGRERQGTVHTDDYARVRKELAGDIKDMVKPDGSHMGAIAYTPEEMYGKPYRFSLRDYPDLMVFFDDLHWRSAGTVGHPSMYLSENDTGPDDAVHDWLGMLIYNDPRHRTNGRRIGMHRIADVGPTVMRLMGLTVPPTVDGKLIDPIIDTSEV
jgi:predicted AlkP superfamily phosphohydrolase/phosphomutase